jgi:nitroreductase
MNEILPAIQNRRSVRSYSEEAVSKEAMEAIVRAGHLAPTAVNRQPLFFVGIVSQEILHQIKDFLGSGKELYGATAMVIVFQLKADPFNELNTGAAMENMLLEIESLGLSGCWIHCLRDRLSSPEGIRFLAKLLGLPEGVVPSECIAVGHIQGEKPAMKQRNFALDKVL